MQLSPCFHHFHPFSPSLGDFRRKSADGHPFLSNCYNRMPIAIVGFPHLESCPLAQDRHFPMKIAPLACLLLGLFSTVASAQDIEWETRLEKARELAESQQKLILLHFTAEWDRSCQQLETFVFSNTLVQSTVRECVVPVRIDIDQRPEIVKEYGVNVVPFDVVLTPAGKILSKRQSPAGSLEFARMVAQISQTESEANDPEAVSIKRDLVELQNKLKPDRNLLLDRDFRPEGPSHEMPEISAESRNLLLKQQATLSRVVQNPYFGSDAPPAAETQNGEEPAINVGSTEETGATADSVEAASAGGASRPEPSRILNPLFAQNSAASRAPSSQPGGDFQPDPGSPPGSSESAVAAAGVSQQKVEFALRGKCPVTLLAEGRWEDGDPQFGCAHRGRIYRFVNQECLQKFLAAPDRFSPLLAGYDPVEFHDQGTLVDGRTEYGTLMDQDGDQRIVLFRNPENLARFKADPGQYIRKVIAARVQMDQSGSNWR